MESAIISRFTSNHPLNFSEDLANQSRRCLRELSVHNKIGVNIYFHNNLLKTAFKQKMIFIVLTSCVIKPQCEFSNELWMISLTVFLLLPLG